ncbi:hypothetical protein CTI14_03275 [Methylobacterium radiotolerans]|nr:hypothetical protein CTI14_03275 [Methylobacterium radiotolerans]
MNALTTRGSDDWLRARRSQAAQARQQAGHHRRLAEIWDAQAAEFEADIAHVQAERVGFTPTTEAAE